MEINNRLKSFSEIKSTKMLSSKKSESHLLMFVSLHIVWFGLILWYINHCWLFNAKSICIHINNSILNNSISYKYSFLLTHS